MKWWQLLILETLRLLQRWGAPSAYCLGAGLLTLWYATLPARDLAAAPRSTAPSIETELVVYVIGLTVPLLTVAFAYRNRTEAACRKDETDND